MSDKCPHEGQVTALDNDKRNINRSVATTDKNGNGDGRVAARTSLIHSVSIIVDSFNEDESRQGDDASRNLETTMTTNKCCDASKGRQSPIILLEEIDFGEYKYCPCAWLTCVRTIYDAFSSAYVRTLPSFSYLLQSAARSQTTTKTLSNRSS